LGSPIIAAIRSITPTRPRYIIKTIINLEIGDKAAVIPIDKPTVPKQCLQGLCVLNLTAHLYLKDSIKVSEEAFKLKKKIQEVEKFIVKLQDKMKKPDYEKKVPAEVRKQEMESLETYNSQMEKIKQTLQIVEKLE